MQSCSNSSYQNLYMIIREMCRVLRVGGFCISVTFASADMRAKHLSRAEFPWKMDIVTLTTPTKAADDEAPQPYYVYVMQKLGPYRIRTKPDVDLLAQELRECSPSFADVEHQLEKP